MIQKTAASRSSRERRPLKILTAMVIGWRTRKPQIAATRRYAVGVAIRPPDSGDCSTDPRNPPHHQARNVAWRAPGRAVYRILNRR